MILGYSCSCESLRHYCRLYHFLTKRIKVVHKFGWIWAGIAAFNSQLLIFPYIYIYILLLLVFHSLQMVFFQEQLMISDGCQFPFHLCFILIFEFLLTYIFLIPFIIYPHFLFCGNLQLHRLDLPCCFRLLLLWENQKKKSIFFLQCLHFVFMYVKSSFLSKYLIRWRWLNCSCCC